MTNIRSAINTPIPVFSPSHHNHPAPTEISSPMGRARTPHKALSVCAITETNKGLLVFIRYTKTTCLRSLHIVCRWLPNQIEVSIV